MTQTRTIEVLGLIVITLAVGCTTPPAIVSTQTPGERTQRLLAIAEEYDKNGQSQAALRIYDHLLIQQPNHREAQERRQLLTERAGLPSSMINGSRQVYASRSSSGRNTSMTNKGPIPTSAVPDNSQTSIDAEMKAAALLRPVSPAENSLKFAGRIEPLPQETSVSKATSELRQVSAAVNENRQAVGGESNLAEQADVKASKPLRRVTYPQGETSEVETENGRWKTFEPRRSERREEVAEAEPLFSALNRPGPHHHRKAASSLPSQERRSSSVLQVDRVEAFGEATDLTAEAPVLRETIQRTISDHETIARIHTAWALREINGDEEVLLQVLRGCLNDESEGVSCLAIYLIGKIGVGAVAATRDLVELRDGTHGVRSLYASEALMKVSPTDEQSINVLKAALASDEQQVRWVAATLLGNATGVFQIEAASALKAVIQDDDVQVSVAACLSLGGFESHGGVALRELRNAADFGNQDVRIAAAIALNCLHDNQGPWPNSVARN